jgi:hypothetical protein
VTSSPTEGITYNFAFEKRPSTGGIKFLPGPDSTHVTWYADGDMGFNPINRYFGLFMDGFIGPDLAKGLANLKKKVEDANNRSLSAQLDRAAPSEQPASPAKPADEKSP